MRTTSLYWLTCAFLIALLPGCRSTKTLTEGQYMLAKNTVTVVDSKDPQIDNLKSYVRPLTNKKFMGVFNLKTMCYTGGQPRLDPKTGEWKDSKFRQWLRNRVGEPPVLLDSTEIQSSISQLGVVMNKYGYFDATFDYNVQFKKSNPKKASVHYFVTANEPYTVSNIRYDIDIPEYRKIVVLNLDETLLYSGMQYSESVITNELTRIINDIKDEGYFYVEKSIIHCEVSYDEALDTASAAPKSVSLDIVMKIPNVENADRYLYKYYFNDVYIQTDYDATADASQPYDTVLYHNRRDSTNFYFITPHYDWLSGPIQDFKYKVIADAIHMHKGNPYTQLARRRSSQSLNQLDNFSFMSQTFEEKSDQMDSVRRTGVLDTYFRLTRQKVHSIGGQLDLRNDKSAISFSYTNRNLFKGGEHLTLNLSGGYFYYSLTNLFRKGSQFTYPEFSASVAMTFPKLFLFHRAQQRDAVRYSTTLNFGVNYSGLYKRMIYNTNITYNWSPNYYTNHTISPIDISTLNINNRIYSGIINYHSYPESYQKKFGKFFLLSLKYGMDYLVPFNISWKKDVMRISINAESSGLFLKGLNALFSPGKRWVLAKNKLDEEGYDYSTFEKFEITWNYTHTFNKNNAFATRFNAGAIIPLDKDSYVPYEKGFFMGTSNSMRGWGYRGLGPGSYEHRLDSIYTGDIKLEWNLEYRGTIYGSFKYGVFSDVGNIWLARASDDMSGAEFSFKRFYTELAADVGVGLRLDFDFLVVRVDYALPIYDPQRTSQGRWMNKNWFSGAHRFKWNNGLKIAIGYAF